MRHKETSAQKILSQIHSLVADAQESIVDTSTTAYEGLREKVESAQESIVDTYNGAKKSVVAGARHADQTVRKNPYETAAIAAGIGLLVGFAIGRRRR